MGKPVKDAFDRVRRDPDPGVTDVEPERREIPLVLDDRDLNLDLSLRRELHGITHEVGEDLAEPHRISNGHDRLAQRPSLFIEREIQPILGQRIR